MLDIKADHPLLTPGAFMYSGIVVLEYWLRGWALIRAVQEMRAPVNSYWFYRGYPAEVAPQKRWAVA